MQVLQEYNEQQRRIVELKFFGGLELEEIAAGLNIADPKVVGREWQQAKMWLRIQLLAGEQQ